MAKRQAQVELAFSTHGGRRRGAGRKPKGERARVSHAARAALTSRLPVLVTMKMLGSVGSLRRKRAFNAIWRSLRRARGRFGARIVHFSVQRDHIHLFAEAASAQALARAMQGLSVRIARGLNAALERRGAVFADRYHERVLRSPKQTRHAIGYVLGNAKKHGIGRDAPRGWVDAMSSAPFFDGWCRSVRFHRESWTSTDRRRRRPSASSSAQDGAARVVCSIPIIARARRAEPPVRACCRTLPEPGATAPADGSYRRGRARARGAALVQADAPARARLDVCRGAPREPGRGAGCSRGAVLASATRVRAIGLALLLGGCTVISPDPARDSGASRDASEPCARELVVEPTGPDAGRVLCPLPGEPSAARPELRAMMAELAAIEHRFCEQERARISQLSREAWASELDVARATGRSPASMEVHLDAFGIRGLEPLPREAARGCTLEERAIEWLRRHRTLSMLESDDDLRLTSVDAGSITFEQRWRGVPVAGAGLVLHEDPIGFTRLDARLVPAWAMPASAHPVIGASEAMAIASEHEPHGSAALAVWPAWDAAEPSARLAWVIGECAVDAIDGALTCLPR